VGSSDEEEAEEDRGHHAKDGMLFCRKEVGGKTSTPVKTTTVKRDGGDSKGEGIHGRRNGVPSGRREYKWKEEALLIIEYALE